MGLGGRLGMLTLWLKRLREDGTAISKLGTEEVGQFQGTEIVFCLG